MATAIRETGPIYSEQFLPPTNLIELTFPNRELSPATFKKDLRDYLEQLRIRHELTEALDYHLKKVEDEPAPLAYSETTLFLEQAVSDGRTILLGDIANLRKQIYFHLRKAGEELNGDEANHRKFDTQAREEWEVFQSSFPREKYKTLYDLIESK